MVTNFDVAQPTEIRKLTTKEAWAARRDAVHPFSPPVKWRSHQDSYKERQRLRPARRLIATSSRLREFQKLAGLSAMRWLKHAPWSQGVKDGFLESMADSKITLKEGLVRV